MNWLKCADQILSLTESRAIKTVQTIVGANQEGSNSIFWPGQQKGSLEWRRVPTKYLVRRLAQLWRRPDGYREHITEESRIDKSKMPKCLALFFQLDDRREHKKQGGPAEFWQCSRGCRRAGRSIPWFISSHNQGSYGAAQMHCPTWTHLFQYAINSFLEIIV